MRAKSSLLLMVCCSLVAQALASPYRPSSDAEVIETLPRGATALVRKSGAAPSLDLAREYLRLGQSHAEPRYVRVAESLAARGAPGPERCLMRGLTEQYFHQFDSARRHFQAGLALAPRHEELLLQLAMLHTVQGRFLEARETMGRAPALLGTMRGVTVLAIISSLNGQLPASFRLLEQQFSRLEVSATEAAWVASSLAEMALREGKFQLAEHYLRQARMLEPESVPWLIQTVDFLLSQKRYREALSLANDSNNPMLGLRQAIALKNLAGDEARFAEIKRQLNPSLAGTLHRRELSLFQLQVMENFQAALDEALENFAQQREPIDAWLVLESARRAGAYDKAAPALRWLSETRLEDVSIQALLPAFQKSF